MAYNERDTVPFGIKLDILDWMSSLSFFFRLIWKDHIVALRDRFDEAFENFKENETVKRVKLHVKKNKKTYIVGTIGVVAYATKGRVPKQRIINAFIYKSTITNEQYLIEMPRRMHPGYVTKCLETKLTTSSQRQMGKVMSLNPSEIGKAASGEIPDVQGWHFVRIGEAQA